MYKDTNKCLDKGSGKEGMHEFKARVSPSSPSLEGGTLKLANAFNISNVHHCILDANTVNRYICDKAHEMVN